MSPLKSAFNIETLRRYREPGILFGGGLLAGFLIFLAWLAFRSSSDVDSVATEPEAATAAAQKLQAGGDGVLGGITGGAQSGKARVATPASASAAASAEATASNGNAATRAGAEADGKAGNPTGAMSEGEAITSGLFGPEPASAAPAPETTPEAAVSEPAKDQ